jgi:hypothetical protein
MNPLEREAHKHWERWCRLRHVTVPLTKPPKPESDEPERIPDQTDTETNDD